MISLMDNWYIWINTERFDLDNGCYLDSLANSMLVIAYAEFNIEQAVMEWIGENTNHSTHLIPQGE